MYQDLQFLYTNQALSTTNCLSIVSPESSYCAITSISSGVYLAPALKNNTRSQFCEVSPLSKLTAEPVKQETPEKNVKKRTREENSASENIGQKRRKIEETKSTTPLQSQSIFSPKVPDEKSSKMPLEFISRRHSI